MRIARILQTKGDLVLTIAPETPLKEAARELAKHGVGAMVVTDVSGELVGILSERDIARAVGMHGEGAFRFRAGEIMTTEVITCVEQDTVDSLMATMTNHRIRHVPVVRDDLLVGIVSIGDVVKHRLDELADETRALHDYLTMGR